MNAGEAAPSPDGLPPAAGLPPSPPPPGPQLDEALDAHWFGGLAAATSRGNAGQQTSGMPERARGNGFLSWLFSWGGDAAPSGSSGNNKRSRRPAAARAAAQRPGRQGAEGAATPRLPRPKSTAKLHPGAGGSSAHAAPADGAPPGAGPAALQQQRSQPQQQQQQQVPAAPQQPADGRRRSTRSAAVQASYAARRQAWRQRIDAIKAKQASRQRDPAAPDAAAAPAPSGGPGSHRVFSKHVAIPVGHGGAGGGRAGSAAGSHHNTPYGSPKRHEPLLDAAGAALPQLEVPPIWMGFQTAEALADLAAASGDQLRRFLQQAGWPAEAAAALPDHDALMAAVRSARSAWEVERVIVACTWPEEVLRVPRKCTDAAALKAAYRRVSIAVHPDKCSAEGASDAMSIVADCYATLLAAANEGRVAKAVPAFMRAAHSSRSLHASGSTANLAGGATGSASGQQAQQAQQQQAQQQQGQGERRQTAEGQAQGRPSPGLPPHPPAWHSRHASAESFFTEVGASTPWADCPPQQQGQGDDSLPQRHNSSSLSEAGVSPLLGRTGSTASSQDWNPHGQLSSEEREAVAAAAWDRATGGWPVAAMRSRSSSAASVSAAAGAPQQLPSRRGSSSSLASSAGPGGSQHGAAGAAAAAAQDALQQEGSGDGMRSPAQQPAGLGSPSPAGSGSPEAANGGTPGSVPPADSSPGTPAGTANGRASPVPQQQAAPGLHASGGRTSPMPQQPPANGGRTSPLPQHPPANGAPPVPPRPASAGAGTWPRPSGAAGSGGPPQKQKVRITLKVVRKDSSA